MYKVTRESYSVQSYVFKLTDLKNLTTKQKLLL